MAQDFYSLDVTRDVKTVIPQMQAGLESVASNFSGTAFPTNNLFVGMKCYRTDIKDTFRWDGTVWVLDSPSYAASAGTCTGNAATATMPLGFSSGVTTAPAWDTPLSKQHPIVDWGTQYGGEISFRDNGGQLSVAIDGTFYQNEGKYKVIDTSGGNMTGNLSFADIGDVDKSKGICWAGSTDGASIYYQTTAADQGNLVLNIVDDANAAIQFATNGIFKSCIDANGVFNGNVNGNAVTATLADKFSRRNDNITNTTDDTTANWAAKGPGMWFYGTTNQLNNQPAQYGHLLNMTDTGSEVSQLWINSNSADVYIRGGNAGGWNQSFTKLAKINDVTAWLGTTGYIKIPNNSGSDLIIEWTNDLAGKGTSGFWWNYPVALNNVFCATATVTDGGADNQQYNLARISSLSTASLHVNAGCTENARFSVIVIGR